MNQTQNNQEPITKDKEPRYLACSRSGRTYYEIDPLLAELPTGTQVIKQYWANDRYVTIPGDSAYIMTDTGLVHQPENE